MNTKKVLAQSEKKDCRMLRVYPVITRAHNLKRRDERYEDIHVFFRASNQTRPQDVPEGWNAFIMDPKVSSCTSTGCARHTRGLPHATIYRQTYRFNYSINRESLRKTLVRLYSGDDVLGIVWPRCVLGDTRPRSTHPLYQSRRLEVRTATSERVSSSRISAR